MRAASANLETLIRQAEELLVAADRDKEPLLITQGGLGRAYLVNAAAFDGLCARLDILEGIARGENAIDDGRTVCHAQARHRMRRWFW